MFFELLNDLHLYSFSVGWYLKNWAAKQEREEIKEGTSLEFALALLRKKTNEEWTAKHRNVARKLEGGWVQKRLFDVAWSDESKCQACHKEEGTEKHRLYHCPEWYDVRREIPEAFTKAGAKRENVEAGVEMAKVYCIAPSQ